MRSKSFEVLLMKSLTKNILDLSVNLYETSVQRASACSGQITAARNKRVSRIQVHFLVIDSETFKLNTRLTNEANRKCAKAVYIAQHLHNFRIKPNIFIIYSR